MTADISELQSRLLDVIQQQFPIVHDPYGSLAAKTGSTREDVHQAVLDLRQSGIIRRLGGSFVPAKLGHVSVLASAKVEPSQLEKVAAVVSGFDEVTHNYERNAEYNLWFTVIADGQERLAEIIASIRVCDGVSEVHALPATQTFKLKVNFKTRSGS